MDIYESIKCSLIKAVKQVYPKHKVFAEDIKKLNDEIRKNNITDYVYIALYPIDNEYTDKYVDRTILISIMVHDSSEANSLYLQESSKLEKVICPVFHFDDRYITVNDTHSTIDDWKLHFSFTLTFKEVLKDEEDTASYLEDLTMQF